MTSPATTADIESRWRPLATAEFSIAETRLGDAWRKLKRDVPTLEVRMATDADLNADAVRVLADAVIRVLQSNERGGLRKGSVGVDDASRSWELDDSVRQALYFTADEIADLSPGDPGSGPRRAFSLMPS